MNRAQLQAAALAEGISPSAYSLEGGLPEDRYVLSVAQGGWDVYFVERGQRLGGLHFETEDEACDELLLRLVRDPTTRRPLV